MRTRQVLSVIGAVLGLALLMINAIFTFQVLEHLRADENKVIDVAVDWHNQRQVAVNIAGISLNADMYDDVPTGFLPIMPAWTEDEDGKLEHVDLPVTVGNRQLDVWVRNPELDVYVGSGSITVDNPSDF
jgi:hypothetical protein